MTASIAEHIVALARHCRFEHSVREWADLLQTSPRATYAALHALACNGVMQRVWRRRARRRMHCAYRMGGTVP